ncbi:hypothetical protein C0Q70_00858 [Pomacea canaliculata]|uniref:Uncharacterized protein n=1 Tax=Pomacea canaliculata TaxID=400727 RepID=A0A2T7PXY8_POMCA|nr:hypothetical protein C0Q70_00858 [Pomacea canaliculata]
MVCLDVEERTQRIKRLHVSSHLSVALTSDCCFPDVRTRTPHPATAPQHPPAHPRTSCRHRGIHHHHLHHHHHHHRHRHHHLTTTITGTHRHVIPELPDRGAIARM